MALHGVVNRNRHLGGSRVDKTVERGNRHHAALALGDQRVPGDNALHQVIVDTYAGGMEPLCSALGGHACEQI